MTSRPQGHGYVDARVEGENLLFARGAELRGHEFHNSRLVDVTGDLALVYGLRRGRGMGNGRDGLAYGNALASYTHLHVAGAPGWAEGFVARAAGRMLA
jgi:cobyrinic acid a,c-diamide synthase